MITKFEPEEIKSIAIAVADILGPAINTKNSREPDVIMGVDELAQYLKVEKSWIYEQVKNKTIPYYKLKKYVRFKKLEIDAWFKAHAQVVFPKNKRRESDSLSDVLHKIH